MPPSLVKSPATVPPPLSTPATSKTEPPPVFRSLLMFSVLPWAAVGATSPSRFLRLKSAESLVLVFAALTGPNILLLAIMTALAPRIKTEVWGNQRFMSFRLLEVPPAYFTRGGPLVEPAITKGFVEM